MLSEVLVGNFLVTRTGPSEQAEVEDLVFPDGKPVVFNDSRWGGLERLNDAPGNACRHGCAAEGEITDGLDDLVRRRLLKQITGCAGADGIEYVVIIVEDGEHEDLDARVMGLHRADAFDARDIGQADIHQDDIRQGAANLCGDIQQIAEGRYPQRIPSVRLNKPPRLARSASLSSTMAILII